MTPPWIQVQPSDRHDTPVDKSYRHQTYMKPKWIHVHVKTSDRHDTGGYKYRHPTDMTPRWIQVLASDRHDTPVDTSTDIGQT